MSKFNIKLARIERTVGSGDVPEVCITFQIERGEISFQMPIRLNVSDYNDTEMIQVARDILNRTFSELAAQSLEWKLSAEELGGLSRMNVRPKGPAPPASHPKR
jgi:hypothetical protein